MGWGRETTGSARCCGVGWEDDDEDDGECTGLSSSFFFFFCTGKKKANLINCARVGCVNQKRGTGKKRTTSKCSPLFFLLQVNSRGGVQKKKKKTSGSCCRSGVEWSAAMGCSYIKHTHTHIYTGIYIITTERVLFVLEIKNNSTLSSSSSPLQKKK